MRLAILALLALPLCAADYVSQTVLLLDAGKGVTISNSGTGGAQPLTLSLATAAGNRIKWWGSLVNVPNRGSQQSCADPCGITMNRTWGQQYYWFEEVDSAGNPLSPRKLSSAQTTPMIQPACATSGSWTLPVEVIGQDNFVACVQASVSGSPPASGLVLEVRVNNHGMQRVPYDGKMSVKINGGAWIALTNSSTTEVDENKWFSVTGQHGIAFGSSTIRLTVPLPSSAVTSGTNSFSFRFNGTDGITSGYRVLEFNVLDTATSRQMSQIAVSSNVATATTTAAHPYAVSDWVFLYQAPGIQGRFNGPRQIAGVAGSTFSFAPCGSGLGFYSVACTSPNGTYAVPTSYQSPALQAAFPFMSQPTMGVMRQLIPQSQFSYDDPTTWMAPPSGNVTNGQTFWNSGTLANPVLPYLNNSLSVHCADCHDKQGRDLSYFRYSNSSIEQRVLFHNGTWQNALDVAAYIRSLDAATTPPSIARPWNPPQQPCTGLDSAALNSWDAGGGIDCQLSYDNDALEYMAPGGSYTSWAPANFLNMREQPVMWQYQDWTHWLPTIHPADYFSGFVADQAFTNYVSCRDGVAPGTFAAYSANYSTCNIWQLHLEEFQQSVDPLYVSPTSNGTNWGIEYAGLQYPALYNLARYSVYQWLMTKSWEVYHSPLEGMQGQLQTALYGASPEGYYDRGWLNNRLWFNQAPHIQGPQHTPLYDSLATWNFLSNTWYVAQATNSCGNRRSTQAGSMDWNYYFLFLNTASTYRPAAYENSLPWIQSPQCGYDTPNGVDGTAIGTVFHAYEIISLNNSAAYSFLSPTEMSSLMGQYAAQWAATTGTKSGAFWTAWLSNGGGTTCTNAHNAYTSSSSLACDSTAMAIPMFQYWGASSGTLDTIQAWAAALWPSHDFTIDRAATCNIQNVGLNGTPWVRCTNAL